ncbi:MULTISPECIES: dethiobiotin synthase [unclassified Campylobacter]|uniref:dethiobiotin synthase n=1 Tax=unclassified Campylobacter TaxID=2593542 RepID=UPI001237A833|nr:MULTISPECIES: dethiobiotin synthase [unclassified Campylobacter]KAA6226480.1 dethiobiotin synthase [Campylobacter sp. LR185c]KAA6228615.1 dethiobiotin synthase [Campylobacter sp. LR196d]KAA6229168.1 dethiobiotin synthase [Campylobacter sp. LR286c]KAA6233959.1 dethiobiotin synthase [Campylobacter sp. LR291e]KAA6234198.1 dethiobiotin synthase [Campylobacter sp. LR264d]
MKIYISGIHTDAGKTHLSALMCANLNFDYFKLIQAGVPTDSELIAKFSQKTKIFETGFFLKTPTSPHRAKILENAKFNAFDIKIPKSDKLVIELAGGLFTPIDEKTTMIDYMSEFNFPTILVAKYYLGSINHILLSIDALKQRKIKILCIVMMGKKDILQDEFIKNYTQIPLINVDFFNEKSVINNDFKLNMQKILN